MKQKPLAMIIIGCTLILMSAAALIVGAGVFTAARPVPAVLDWIGFICFFGWWIPGITGLVLLILGIIKVNAKRTD